MSDNDRLRPDANVSAGDGRLEAKARGGTPQNPLRHIDVDEDNASKGLAQLVLTLIKLVHDLLEKRAVARMENDTLTAEETERIGQTLKKQLEEIEHICDVFGLELDDLDLDLGAIEHHDAS
ncbi:MAG: gas vesicle protein K [Salinibacter sp.]|uniref:gas vesicle protein K n=1 Tax=Salinibacter sp. TaxID=2065818 RepID=UPI0035D49749